MVAIKDLTAGTGGGILQCLVGHPFDTVKVRLQTDSVTNPKYNGVVDCVKKIVGEEGVGGLFKGVQSPLTGIAALNAVLFFSYGQFKTIFQKYPN